MNWKRRAVTLRMTPEQEQRAAKEGLKWEQQLDLPEGAALLRTGIFDTASGRVGTAEAGLDRRQRRPPETQDMIAWDA